MIAGEWSRFANRIDGHVGEHTGSCLSNRIFPSAHSDSHTLSAGLITTAKRGLKSSDIGPCPACQVLLMPFPRACAHRVNIIGDFTPSPPGQLSSSLPRC
jgi:hypothetical protein